MKHCYGLVAIILAGLVMAWVLGELSSPAPQQKHSPPLGLTCEKSRHDFGTLSYEKARGLRHVFLVSNPTATPIKIRKIATTCGCTVAKSGEEVVVPGGQTPVTVNVDYKLMPGPQSVGVVVQTDAFDAPQLHLQLSARIEVPVMLSQSSLKFGNLHPEEEKMQIVKVLAGTAADTSDMNVNVKVSVPWLSVQPSIVPSDKKTEVIQAFAITAHGKPTPGPLSTVIKFELTGTDLPPLLLKVDATSLPALQVTPTRVIFSEGGPDVHTIRVMPNIPIDCTTIQADITSQNSSFRVVSVECDDNCAVVKVARTGKEVMPHVTRSELRIRAGSYTSKVTLLNVQANRKEQE